MNGGKLELFEDFLKKPEMNPSYLDNFDLSSFNLPKVSAIVPTYNRCPHTAKEDANPLGWCLESLLAQKGDVLDEIIIMDDASTDFTEEVVEDFQNKSEIDIKYFQNSKNVGSSINRNKAVRESRNDQIIFLDDDCIFSNYFVFGAGFTLNNLPIDSGAVHLPVYHRSMKPFSVDLKDIGVLDLETGLMTGNYGGFPVSYYENLEKNLLDSRLGIVNPLEITNLGGVFIAKKEAFQEAGGFPEFLVWKNGYREETNLAMGFSDKGYKMFFTPDPKFYSVHLKYGSKGAEEEINKAEPLLKRLISYSSVQRENTGNRVDPEEWFFDRIISTYVTLGRKNVEAADNYRRATEEEFVKKNKLSISGVGTKINDFFKRKNIFDRAIQEGNKLIGVAG